MAATTTNQKDTFVTVPGDRHSEVARTLAEPVPQALSLLDQFGLWGNLGVSLLGFTGAIFVLQPGGAGTPIGLGRCSGPMIRVSKPSEPISGRHNRWPTRWRACTAW